MTKKIHCIRISDDAWLALRSKAIETHLSISKLIEFFAYSNIKLLQLLEENKKGGNHVVQPGEYNKGK